MQSFMTIKNWTTVAVFGSNGRAVFGFNGSAVFGFNGGAVSFDSQGCKPLVGISTMIRESRSDGIGPSDTIGHHTKTTNQNYNATAPPFPNLRGTVPRGLHPWLSNTIAPRFNNIALQFNNIALRLNNIAPRLNNIAPQFNNIAPRFNCKEVGHAIDA